MTEREYKIQKLKNRIALLENRPSAIENKNIVAKLNRELRRLTEE